MVDEFLEQPAVAPSGEPRQAVLTLLTSIFLIAACGLVYELLIATVSSYFLGNSVTQFSLAIGVFIGAMGLGSHFSQYLQHHLLSRFILVEILLGVLGGLSVPLLFATYAAGPLYTVVLYGTLITIGALTGLELPLLTRLLKEYGELRQVIAQALSFDYVGALVGSVLFPLVLLPSLGLMRTAFLVALLNIGVALWNLRVFLGQLRGERSLAVLGGTVGVALVAGFIYSLQVVQLLEERLYEDEIIFTAQTPYQRIVMTRWREDFRLFLDGNLQFSALDEYRYHESLVHPALALAPVAQDVLILGGGDGLGVREVLKHPHVKKITLIDLDERMTQLGASYPALVKLNGNAFKDPRVRVVNQDAYKFLEASVQLYDVILIDLPDPNNDALAKLYSREFYKLVKRHLAAAGVVTTQATSPFFAREAFWGIVETMEAAGLKTVPYHAYVPSFGDWGFVLAAGYPLKPERANFQASTRFLTPQLFQEMQVFGKDITRIEVEVSTLDRPTILDYYLNNWKQGD